MNRNTSATALRRLCALLFATALAFTAPAQKTDSNTHQSANKNLKVYYFKIEEDIAPPAALRTEKALEAADKMDADLVVVKINTFGGTLDDADKIRTAILQCKRPVYAYIDNNAASAGALISIACDSIYMHSGSSLGAATVVDQTGAVQPDKYQSYMRSLMRTTAEARGRRTDIAEAMVDPDISVAGISDSGKVLTFTSSEAVKYGYCQGVCENIDEVLAHAGIHRYSITEQRYNAIEKIIGFLLSPVVHGILIMLIIGGIYFELQSPGIGFPLIVAVTGAALYFAPLYLEGLAANWEILIFIAGVVLLALELFVVPGFGVCGILGLVGIVGGLTLSLIDNIGFDFSHIPTIHIGESLALVTASITIAVPLSIWLGKKLLETKTIGRVVLHSEQQASEGFTVADANTASLIGCEGVASTILRPSGKVKVDGKTFDAVATVSYIDKGTPIKVTGYENGSLLVSKL